MYWQCLPLSALPAQASLAVYFTKLPLLSLTHSPPYVKLDNRLNMELDYETGMSIMEKWACFTPLTNANGCPSINLPIQHDDENDLPIGILLWANYGNDKLLLELSYQIEEASPWKKIYE